MIRNYSCFDEIIVVDNCSTDSSYESLNAINDSKMHVIETNYNGGYGYGNNAGMKYAFYNLGCDYSIIANPDVEFSEDLIVKCLNYMSSNLKIGVISAIQKDSRGVDVLRSAWKLPKKLQYILSICQISPRGGKLSVYYKREELYAERAKVVGCVAGSLLCISKEAFQLTGGYDEKVFLYCEETILGYKLAKAGLKSILLTDTSYLHFHGATIGKAYKQYYKRQKLLNKSHHYVVKNYLKANIFERILDLLFCEIALLKSYMSFILRKIKRGKV